MCDGGFKSVNVGVVENLKFLHCFLNFRECGFFCGEGVRALGEAPDGVALSRKYGGQISVIPIADQVFAGEMNDAMMSANAKTVRR